MIELDGAPVQGSRADRMVRRGVALVPERRDLFPDMSVAENLAMGAYTRRDTAGTRGDLARIYDYFPQLAARRGQVAETLSGGEQQMLAIGRALMSRPRLLLLDEPSLGLSPAMVSTIFDVLEQINRSEGMTILLVEQNTSVALEIAHDGYVLDRADRARRRRAGASRQRSCAPELSGCGLTQRPLQVPVDGWSGGSHGAPV